MQIYIYILYIHIHFTIYIYTYILYLHVCVMSLSQHIATTRADEGKWLTPSTPKMEVHPRRGDKTKIFFQFLLSNGCLSYVSNSLTPAETLYGLSKKIQLKEVCLKDREGHLTNYMFFGRNCNMFQSFGGLPRITICIS